MVKVSATIYGKGGTGKTSLLGTMPGQGLILDIPQVEGGTVVLKGRENIDVFSVEQWNHFQDVYDGLRQGVLSPTTNKPYTWVAIDTISAAQELAKRKALRERQLDSAPNQTSQQDWGKIGQLMSELFYQFGTLTQHVIFTSQERLRESNDGSVEYQPAISPMSLDALHPPQFLIGRLYMAEVFGETGVRMERRLRVQTGDRYFVKVRAIPGRELKSVLVEPNLGEIFRWLLGVENATEPKGIDINEASAGGANPFAAVQE